MKVYSDGVQGAGITLGRLMTADDKPTGMGVKIGDVVLALMHVLNKDDVRDSACGIKIAEQPAGSYWQIDFQLPSDNVPVCPPCAAITWPGSDQWPMKPTVES